MTKRYISIVMRRFTKEEIERLSVAEQTFRTAKANYKRATAYKQDEEFCNLYEEATGERLSHTWGCGRCSLTLYQKLGKKYWEDKEYWENEEKQAQEQAIITPDEEIPHQEEEKPRKSPGRPKKNNNTKTKKK